MNAHVCLGDQTHIAFSDLVKPIDCGSKERAAFIVRACNNHAALVAALSHFANLPLEEFGYENKKDDRTITGFNNWNLSVGHIRAARAALAATKEPA